MDFALEGRLIGACIVVAIVLFAVSGFARFVSRSTVSGVRPGGRPGRLLAVVETAFLPSAASVHVVRVAERYYAIGRSGSHIATLCEIPAESIARSDEQPGPATLLKRLRQWRR